MLNFNWTVQCRRISVRNSPQTQNSQNLVNPLHPFQFSHVLDIFHRSRQYHRCAMYNISKRLSQYEISYGQTSPRLIWVLDTFLTDILCCTRPLIVILNHKKKRKKNTNHFFAASTSYHDFTKIHHPIILLKDEWKQHTKNMWSFLNSRQWLRLKFP